ncbi:collagen alpha-2(IV) chain-like [Cotesia glomerata]|uniref:collagen alpha-2(IV) chain-like n=1 Tax=Cotesia glomerata TaxID=32391 RepID=UPI001D011C9A|nr:collagen alpha-2(IV) chain-like [Cotesia glomerata]
MEHTQDSTLNMQDIPSMQTQSGNFEYIGQYEFLGDLGQPGLLGDLGQPRHSGLLRPVGPSLRHLRQTGNLGYYEHLEHHEYLGQPGLPGNRGQPRQLGLLRPVEPALRRLGQAGHPGQPRFLGYLGQPRQPGLFGPLGQLRHPGQSGHLGQTENLGQTGHLDGQTGHLDGQTGHLDGQTGHHGPLGHHRPRPVEMPSLAKLNTLFFDALRISSSSSVRNLRHILASQHSRQIAAPQHFPKHPERGTLNMQKQLENDGARSLYPFIIASINSLFEPLDHYGTCSSAAKIAYLNRVRNINVDVTSLMSWTWEAEAGKGFRRVCTQLPYCRDALKDELRTFATPPISHNKID